MNNNPSEIRIGDCLDVLNELPSGSANLVFADPPYNTGIDYGYGAKADKLPPSKFVSWCPQWIAGCRRVFSDDRSFWLLISDDFFTWPNLF